VDNRVYVVRCADYEHAGEKLSELFNMMGGIGPFVKPGESIVLKVNLLRPAAPEEVVSTHPAVVAAIGQMTKDHGAIPLIVDSPGAGYRYNEKVLAKTYRISGMYQAAEKAGIEVEVNLDTSHEIVSFPEGKLIRRFEIITPLLRSDGVFNLCKMKTHTFMHMTGAVKNNFGAIAGLTKAGYHGKLRDTGRFAGMLLDLADFVSPRISIMDAVLAMEGEGPSAGSARQVGLFLASTSPLALDVVAGEIMGLSREKNPVLVEAEKRGLQPNRLEEVEVIGAEIEELTIPDFDLPATIYGGSGVGGEPLWVRMLEPLFKHSLSVKPQIIKAKCVACGACSEACPMKVITLVDGRHAQIDYKSCIRCYCCHEMCPEKAIELHEGILHRVLNR